MILLHFLPGRQLYRYRTTRYMPTRTPLVQITYGGIFAQPDATCTDTIRLDICLPDTSCTGMARYLPTRFPLVQILYVWIFAYSATISIPYGWIFAYSAISYIPYSRIFACAATSYIPYGWIFVYSDTSYIIYHTSGYLPTRTPKIWIPNARIFTLDTSYTDSKIPGYLISRILILRIQDARIFQLSRPDVWTLLKGCQCQGPSLPHQTIYSNRRPYTSSFINETMTLSSLSFVILFTPFPVHCLTLLSQHLQHVPRTILTINVPVVYTGRDVWIWMGEKSITRGV